MVRTIAGFHSRNELKELRNIMSGEKSVNYRLSTSDEFSVFSLLSSKREINSTTYYVNEYGIPTPANTLDITFPSAAITLGIASTSASDTMDIKITGLDSNYDLLTETVTLTGQTEVNTSSSFLRVNQAEVVGTTSNVGTIYIGGSDNTFTAGGEPNLNVYRTIGVDPLDSKGIGISTAGTYTVARGFTACPLNFKINTDATDSKPLLVRGIAQPLNRPELVLGNLVFNGAPEYTFDGFSVVPEKTDLIIRTAKKTANQVDTAVVFWEWVQRKNEFIR